MTKRDYILIAGAIRTACQTIPPTTAQTVHIINELVSALQRDNARFSPATFRAACGLYPVVPAAQPSLLEPSTTMVKNGGAS